MSETNTQQETLSDRLEREGAEQTAAEKGAEATPAQVREADLADRARVAEEIRQDWGADRFEIIKNMKNTLDTLPPRIADVVKNARNENGTAMFNTREGLDMLRRWAEINSYRRENLSEYRRDKAVQEEERELIRWFEKTARLEEGPADVVWSDRLNAPRKRPIGWT